MSRVRILCVLPCILLLATLLRHRAAVSAGEAPGVAGPSTGPSTAPSTTPTTRPAVDEAVAELVGRLSAADWHERDRAVDRLVELGEPARPALRRALAGTGLVEVRDRIKAALDRIDQTANGPTLVTLHFKDAEPKDVVAELAKQAQVDLRLEPSQNWNQGVFNQGKPRVTVDLDRQPFWVAMAEVCGQLEADATMFEGGMLVIEKSFEGSMGGPRCQHGPFMIEVERAHRDHDIHFGRTTRPGYRDDLILRLYVDPKAKLLAYTPYPRPAEAVDDRGNPVIAPGGGGEKLEPWTVPSPCYASIELSLSYPNDGYTKLATLKGNIRVRVAAETETIEIPDLGAALHTPKSGAGVAVEVKDVGVTGQYLHYDVRIKRVSLDDEQWRQVSKDMRSVRITDANGKSYSGNGGGGDGDDEYRYDVQRPADGVKMPLKMSWKVTTRVKEETVPFEFKDLPLPRP